MLLYDPLAFKPLQNSINGAHFMGKAYPPLPEITGFSTVGLQMRTASVCIAKPHYQAALSSCKHGKQVHSKLVYLTMARVLLGCEQSTCIVQCSQHSEHEPCLTGGALLLLVTCRTGKQNSTANRGKLCYFIRKQERLAGAGIQANNVWPKPIAVHI